MSVLIRQGVGIDMCPYKAVTGCLLSGCHCEAVSGRLLGVIIRKWLGAY